MDCVNCATPIPQDAKFCQNCGSQVSDAEGQARVSAGMDQKSFAHMEKMLREETEGEFEIDGLLGRGGMAVVYLAREVHLDRQVAIKVLPPELTFGHGVERFKREAKTAAALDHPNIIPIYRIASEGKLFWYAMKYLEGRSMDEDLRERGRIPLEETIELLDQVATALDYANEKGVIHRDIKPANIMLDSHNRVIVTDFGIAKALTEQTLTASGSVVGTPYYMSPEQGMGKGVTGRADQYSVAVMAYRMLSGQVPFEGDSAIDILHKHCMIAPPPLEVIQSGFPKHVYKAVHKALEKKAEDRFDSVRAFVRSLKAPTPDTDAYPDIPVAPLEVSSDEVATVVMPSHQAMEPPTAAEVSSEAATQITPPSGSLSKVASGAPPMARPMVGAPTESGGKGKLIGMGIGAVIVIAGIVGIAMMTGGGGTDPDPVALNTTQPPAQEDPVEVPAQTPEQQTTPVNPTPAPPTPGQLVVNAAPANAIITLDGARQSSRTIELDAGQYALRVQVPGYEDMRRTVTIEEGQVNQIQWLAAQVVEAVQRPTPRPQQPQPQPPAAPVLGSLLIQSIPAATLSIDGREVREIRQHSDSLSPGTHLIRLRKDGYVTKDTTVTVIAGQEVRVRIRLERSN